MDTIQQTREAQLDDWLQQQFPTSGTRHPLKSDASFRSYHRYLADKKSYIVMDAPPELENCQAFIDVAQQLQQQDVQVPRILASNLKQGFLLLTDFGDQLLANLLTTETTHTLYPLALNTLLKIQSCPANGSYNWPVFDRQQYMAELELFTHWYLQEHCHITLPKLQQQQLTQLFNQLTEEAISQPQVCVHRDYHSRNLMLLPQQQLGVLDFQDALWGPITYDLLSLLRDCYIDWPEAQVTHFVLHYQQLALTAGILQEDNPQQFIRWFDWIGLQRHLKCIGIFARLHLRDHKSNYLQYIPRIMMYIRTVCQRYPEFNALKTLLDRLP